MTSNNNTCTVSLILCWLSTWNLVTCWLQFPLWLFDLLALYTCMSFTSDVLLHYEVCCIICSWEAQWPHGSCTRLQIDSAFLYILLRLLLYCLVGGNPLTVMANQISMELHKIRQKCPLYETHGKSVCTGHEHCPHIFLQCKSTSLRICWNLLGRLNYCKQNSRRIQWFQKHLFDEYIHCIKFID